MEISMSSSVAVKEKPRAIPEPRNGINTPVLLATIDAVGQQPELAKFQFRARSRWIKGTHSQSTMSDFYGAGGEHHHTKPYTADADHPVVLVGGGNAPTPVEYVLHALAACLTSGIGNISAVRGVDLELVESTVEGDIDLQGILGISDKVRNGFKAIRVSFRIKGNAPEEKLRAIIDQARNRSAVYDIITSGVPVAISVNA
jgi:uncharacterized OsmC-like protein